MRGQGKPMEGTYIKRRNRPLQVYAVLFLALLTSGTQVYLNQEGWLAYLLLGAAGLTFLAVLMPRRPPR